MTTTSRTKEASPVELLMNLHQVKITPEQEAAFNDFRDHVRQLVSLRKQIKTAEKQLTQHKSEAPREPREVEDWREWIIYTELVKRHELETDAFKARINDLNAAAGQIISKLKKFMPDMVWFRVDDWAVGISYTNWGGGSREVLIEKWGQHTGIKLDRCYNGD